MRRGFNATLARGGFSEVARIALSERRKAESALKENSSEVNLITTAELFSTSGFAPVRLIRRL